MKADLLRPVVLILWKSKQLLKPLFGKLSKPDGHRALSLFVVISILLLSLSVVVPSQVVANPAFTARTETYVNVSSTTTPFDITVTKPTGTVDGDILFCWLGFRATGSAIDSVPSGWILLGSYSGEYDRYYLYYKIAASEPASWVWSFVSSHRVRAVCSAYTSGDFDPDDPIDVVSNTAYRTGDAVCIAASMTVSAANSPLIFWAGEFYSSSVTFTKPTVPTSDWIEDDDSGNTAPDFWTEVCSFIWSGSGATGDMSATTTVAAIEKHAFAVALNPYVAVEAPTVETDAATDVSYTTATLNGNITATGGLNSTIRGFQWGTSTGNYSWSWNETGDYGTGAFSHGIDSLSDNTTYYFRAFATNDGGTGYGDELDFTTLAFGLPTVTNDAADGIGETMATVYGTIIGTGGINATVRGFEYGFETGNYTEDWNEVGSYEVGGWNHTLDALPYDTTIYWRAYATGMAGTGYSGELSFTTLLPLPFAPANFTATQTGISTGNLTWLMGLFADDVYIRGKEGGYPKSMTDGYLIYFGNETSVNLTGLSLGLNTYYYKAWSSNPTGNSTGYAVTKLGGESMLFIAFIVLALGLTLGWVWRRDGWLAYAGAGGWLLLALYSYGETVGIWPISDIYGGLFWIGMGLVITCALLPTLTRERPAPEEVKEEWEGEDLSSMGFGSEDEKTNVRPLTRQQKWDRSVNRAAKTGVLRTRG